MYTYLKTFLCLFIGLYIKLNMSHRSVCLMLLRSHGLFKPPPLLAYDLWLYQWEAWLPPSALSFIALFIIIHVDYLELLTCIPMRNNFASCAMFAYSSSCLLVWWASIHFKGYSSQHLSHTHCWHSIGNIFPWLSLFDFVKFFPPLGDIGRQRESPLPYL